EAQRRFNVLQESEKRGRTMKHVAACWESYRAACIPHDASPAQVKECRLSFFSGAAILNELMLRGLSPGQEITQQDEQLIGSVMRELAEFGQEIDREKMALFLRR